MSQLLDLIASRLSNLHRNGDGTLQGACPACRQEGGDSQGVHLRVWPSGAFRCVKVGNDKEHNRVIRALIRGDSDSEAALILSGEVAEYTDPDPRLDLPKVYPEEMLARLLPDHSYWVGRGIGETTLTQLGGGVAPLEPPSKLSGRYVLPCRDADSRIIGWAGRQLPEHEWSSFAPRWKIVGKKSRFVFPHPAISPPAIRAAREVVLVEGQGCAMALMSAGLPQCLCLFGVVPSSVILAQLIALNPTRILVATNNEPPKARSRDSVGVGLRAALTIKETLSLFFAPERVLIHLPPTKDVADLGGAERIREWYASAGVSTPAAGEGTP